MNSTWTLSRTLECSKSVYGIKFVSEVQRLGSLGLLLLALFIGSWPSYGACESPGFRMLCPFTLSQYESGLAQQYFWISVAAILLSLSFEHCELLQKPFVTPLALYFGNISFGLYIVHWPFLQTFGRWIIVKIIRSTGDPEFTFGAFPPGFFLSGILITPIVVWLADIYWRLCDVKSVECARCLSVKGFVENE